MTRTRKILAMEHGEDGTRLDVLVREGLAAELERFLRHD